MSIHFRPIAIQCTQFSFRCDDLARDLTDSFTNFAVNELAKSASRALLGLYTKFLNVGGMDHDAFCKLYESLVEPVLLYVVGLKGLSDHKKLKSVQNNVDIGLGKMRQILHCSLT